MKLRNFFMGLIASAALLCGQVVAQGNSTGQTLIEVAGTATATSQTLVAPAFPNGQSYSIATITVSGTFTTVTWALKCSADGGNNYGTRNTWVPTAATSPTATETTTTSGSQYQANIANATNCEIVTSGTFTGTGATFTLTISQNVQVSNATSNAGTVTGVAGDGVMDSNTPASPVAGISTLTPLSQNANCVFAGPATGAATTPTCRLLVKADLPATTPATNTANTFSVIQTAPQWALQTVTSSPQSVFWDDFLTSVLWTTQSVGSPTSPGYNVVACGTNVQRPGCASIASGTAIDTGETIRLNASSAPIAALNGASPLWRWQADVDVAVLPGTTPAGYQSGIVAAANVDPWSSTASFYLSDANPVTGDWYCRYSTTSTDSGVAATTAFVRLSIVNNGTNAVWYINGSPVCSVAINSLPGANATLAHTVATHTASTSVTYLVDNTYFELDNTR